MERIKSLRITSQKPNSKRIEPMKTVCVWNNEWIL